MPLVRQGIKIVKKEKKQVQRTNDISVVLFIFALSMLVNIIIIIIAILVYEMSHWVAYIMTM